MSRSVGCLRDHVRDLDVPTLQLAGRRVDEPVALGPLVEGLGLEHHDPHLAGLEPAALLERRDELLVVQVPVAEVPAERRPGHHLAVDDEVVLVLRARRRG